MRATATVSAGTAIHSVAVAAMGRSYKKAVRVRVWRRAGGRFPVQERARRATATLTGAHRHPLCRGHGPLVQIPARPQA